MTKFRVHKNPFKKDDFVEVEAERFFEEGSFTKFVNGDEVVLAVPTAKVTDIKKVD